MRRITKLGSLTLALLVTVPGLLVLDFFTGADAAPDAPLLFTFSAEAPVTLVALADEPLPSGHVALAQVVAAPDGDVLMVRERSPAGVVRFERAAGDGETAWEIVRLDLSRDGRTVAAATADGRLLFAASRVALYDSFRVFDVGSPVTAIDLDSSGAFLAVVTYHGDLYLFQRDQLLDHDSYALHVPAPVPAGAVPGLSVESAGGASELLRGAQDALRPVRDEAPFSLRPWTHVTFIGQPRADTDPQGLLLAAGTGFGEIFVYDLSSLHSPLGALTLEPFVTRLGDARCEQVTTPIGDVELPCSSAAVDRFLARFPDGPEELPADVVAAVGRAVTEAVPLERLMSPLPVHEASGIVGLAATQGQAESGGQLLVAALGIGPVEAFRVRSMGASGGLPGQGAPPPDVEHLWRMDESRGVARIALSPLHEDGTRAATLAAVTPNGVLSTYRVELALRIAPSVHLETRIETAGEAVSLSHLAVSSAAPGAPDAASAGRYVLAATQLGELRLYQARDREPGGTPALVWAGSLPFPGPVRAVGLQEHGGVAAAGAGVAVYANLVAASIEAPLTVDRHKAWRAEATVDAPDTAVAAIAWRVEPVTTTLPVSPVSGSGNVLEHAFASEGEYRVTLLVVDDRGIEVSVVRDLIVGGRNPILKVETPGTVAMGEEVVFSFAGTHDPNLPEGAGHGIERIEVHPYADSRMGLADLDTMTYRFRAEGPTGLYRSVVVAYDAEGRKTSATAPITVSAPGFALLGEPGGQNVLTGIAVARDSEHTVAFGGSGQDRSRLEVRHPDGSMLLREGTGSQTAPGAAYTSGAVTPDGAVFTGGRSDGSATRIPLGDPASRSSLSVFDAPVRWTFTSADGSRLLFVAEDGRFAAAPGNLSGVKHSHDLGERLVRVVADERLIHVVALTHSGSLVVLDGHRPDLGVRDAHAPAGAVSSLAITPNLDPMGHAWLFLGLSDGRVESLRILVHEFQPIGVVALDADGLAIASIAVGRVDERSRYTYAAVSQSSRIDCAAGTSNPCGSLFFVDSRGPRVDGVPAAAKQSVLESRPVVVLMDGEGRRFVVVGAGVDPSVQTFDQLWEEGALSRMTGFGARIQAAGMTDSAAAHLLTENGRVGWVFAPPRASILVGPHNATGVPQWGERVHAYGDVTLSALNSSAGYGSIAGYTWGLGGNLTEAGPSPVHQWTRTGWHTVIVTVTSRIMVPVETLVSDRAQVSVPVYDPPPVPRLSATPFDAETASVQVESGQKVRFDASASSHPTGARLVDYRFNTGAGFATNKQTPVFEFSYPKPGVYQASVRVADEYGSAATSTTLRVEVSNRAPSAAYSFQQSGPALPAGRVAAHLPVAFDASPSLDPDGQVTAWEWGFPGGVTHTTKTVTHTFFATGDQVVRLRVQDDHGAWSTWKEATVQVEKGIRVDAEQDPPDGSTVSPMQRVTAYGFAHDLRDHPASGAKIVGASLTVRVFFDGFSSTPAASPYQTVTLETDADGWVEHKVGFNQAGISYQPGKYRVEMTGTITGVYGDAVTSDKAVTTFWVDA